MYDEKVLKKETIKNLKSIADENKIDYPAKIKKDDLIKLILQGLKNAETVKEVKENFSGKKSSSSASSSNMNKIEKTPLQDFFDSTPDIPKTYGKDKIVFLVRDPYWGFVYWELTDKMKNDHNLNDENSYLRIYDISNGSAAENSSDYFDIKINSSADNWYINFPQPNRTFIIDLGYIKDGNFITILRSNAASTPRDNVSDQIDQEWMLSDENFASILHASGADRLFEQMGSQELMKFLAGNIQEGNELSSGIISSGGLASSSSSSGKPLR